MRKSFDELWIIDLGGDNLGARKTPNVFAIQILWQSQSVFGGRNETRQLRGKSGIRKL